MYALLLMIKSRGGLKKKLEKGTGAQYFLNAF